MDLNFLDNLKLRLGYGESITLTRDEFNEIVHAVEDFKSLNDSVEEEISTLNLSVETLQFKIVNLEEAIEKKDKDFDELENIIIKIKEIIK